MNAFCVKIGSDGNRETFPFPSPVTAVYFVSIVKCDALQAVDNASCKEKSRFLLQGKKARISKNMRDPVGQPTRAKDESCLWKGDA